MFLYLYDKLFKLVRTLLLYKNISLTVDYHIKIIDYLKHSDELNRYNNLVLTCNLTKLGI